VGDENAFGCLPQASGRNRSGRFRPQGSREVVRCSAECSCVVGANPWRRARTRSVVMTSGRWRIGRRRQWARLCTAPRRANGRHQKAKHE